MKYQKTSTPYLLLLFLMLFALPLLDYEVGSNLVLEYKIEPIKSDHGVGDDKANNADHLITQKLVRSPKK